jgi:hypothetical protein
MSVFYNAYEYAYTLRHNYSNNNTRYKSRRGYNYDLRYGDNILH